jgi:GntR family transcriptional repressor for pyruvate dehydrogenase complex
MDENARPTRASRSRREALAPRNYFSPIQAHRTFETVIDRIVDAIDAQGLGEGDRLPKEAELAHMLEVSRPTLRQALRILEASGVLRIRAGQSGGIFVAADVIPVDVLGRNIAHEVDHAAELLATRRLLEPIVYHLAAENATEEELDRIADAIALMERHIADPKMIRRADGMFHRRIAHAAGNPILLRTMSSIYRQLSPLRDALSEKESDGRHMIDVHTRQLEAIRTRDHARLELLTQETFIDLETEFHVETPYRIRWMPAGSAPASKNQEKAPAQRPTATD